MHKCHTCSGEVNDTENYMITGTLKDANGKHVKFYFHEGCLENICGKHFLANNMLLNAEVHCDFCHRTENIENNCIEFDHPKNGNAMLCFACCIDAGGEALIELVDASKNLTPMLVK